jgi:hypothetical protein
MPKIRYIAETDPPDGISFPRYSSWFNCKTLQQFQYAAYRPVNININRSDKPRWYRVGTTIEEYKYFYRQIRMIMGYSGTLFSEEYDS